MDWAIALGALFSGAATLITAYGAFVKSRREGVEKANAECLERLRAARQEAEHAADELHELRMRHAADES